MNEFIGAYFHSFWDTQWQGQVLGPVSESGNYWYVQTFSWADGSDSTRHIVSVHTMSDWTFYQNAEQMNEAVEQAKARWAKQAKEYGK